VLPFIGGLLCWQGERFGNRLPRLIALISMALLFFLSLWLWAAADFSLAPAPGELLSVLMVVLTGLLGVLSVLCSWSEVQRRVGFFHLNLLWILGWFPCIF